MRKVPYDLRGTEISDFADRFGLGKSSIYGWAKEGEMPYWAYAVLDTTEIDKRDAEIAKRDAEIKRLNCVTDALFSRIDWLTAKEIAKRDAKIKRLNSVIDALRAGFFE